MGCSPRASPPAAPHPKPHKQAEAGASPGLKLVTGGGRLELAGDGRASGSLNRNEQFVFQP